MKNSFFSSDFLQPLLGWLAILSLLTFILSLILIPWVVGRLQRDCFLSLHSNNPAPSPLSIGSIIMAICRNVLGLFLLLAGIIMLFLPGQGLLTILLGTLLISFPGKKKLIGTLIHQPKIQRSMDWLREKRGKSPFLWPKAQSTCKDT
jgi:hypothetical protein